MDSTPPEAMTPAQQNKYAAYKEQVNAIQERQRQFLAKVQSELKALR